MNPSIKSLSEHQSHRVLKLNAELFHFAFLKNQKVNELEPEAGDHCALNDRRTHCGNILFCISQSV